MVNMDEKIFCQSCGMPMTQEAHFATNADGSRNNDYCCYCYDKDPEQARRQMLAWFPTLKRWKGNAAQG